MKKFTVNEKIIQIFRYNHIFARIALVTAIVGITCLAVMPPGNSSLPTTGNDKINHILAFYVLAFLTDISFPALKFSWLKIFTLIAYGLGIELIQLFSSSRSFSFYDLLADAIGICGYIAFREIFKRIKTTDLPATNITVEE
jgi:VanZ family protein